MWIKFEHRHIPSEHLASVTRRLSRQDDNQREAWLNVDTGHVVLLIASGGWRDAADGAAYHAFLIKSCGAVLDVTRGLLGKPRPFLEEVPAYESYAGVLSQATADIDEMLKVRDMESEQFSPPELVGQ